MISRHTGTHFGLLLITAALLLLPSFASAQSPIAESFSYASQIGGGALGDNQLQDVIVSVINVVLSFTALVFTCVIIYGGFLFHTNHVNEEERNYAVATLRSGFIGLAIIMFSMSISKFLLSSLSAATAGSVALTF